MLKAYICLLKIFCLSFFFHSKFQDSGVYVYFVVLFFSYTSFEYQAFTNETLLTF